MRSRAHDDDSLNGYLDLARQGEQDGFTGIYRGLAGRVAGYVRGRGVRDVDEVVNDIFLGAFRNLRTFEGDAAQFRSWLFAIAFNKAADSHRAARRRPPTVQLEDPQSLGVTNDDVELEWAGNNNVEQLLAEVSPDQRNVLLLRIVADLSLAETATVLGKPIGAVKSLQHRALAALARGISTEGVSHPAMGTNTKSR